ncbi:hypothetical protein ABI_29850 [Asticcacaulis biprosthecium C19]|uniref:Uncharacterized protein n=2 Tax=Asticcacaulis biprosthecium TaxID=76891 RepID=F4QMX7_9CAUL|nr:hypothetical protein ABI_29850 [Asticcacaulis biprosthecium C19]
MVPDSAFDTPQSARIFLDRARQLVAQSRHDQATVFETPVTPAPIQGELQSQPYLYTFGLHFRLNVGLYYRALRPIFFAGLAVVYLILLWQNGWGLTEFDRAELLPQLGGFTVITGGFVLIFPLILVPAAWLFGRHHP